MEEKESLIAKSSGLKGKDYIAYALGDVGCCLAFGLVTSLLQSYYTDSLYLHPLFIMIMFIVARVWDAINDPIMGRICDTVKVSKWGRYRPWFLYAGVPLAISAILMFVKLPGFTNSTGTAATMPAYIYATITYILFGMIYTMIQIPYGSLASVVTLDEKERTKLSVYRSVGSTLGSMPVMVLSMLCFASVDRTNSLGVPVLDSNGNVIKDQIVKYPVLLIGVILMAVASAIVLLLAFFGNKERVQTQPLVREKGATGNAIKRMFKSRSLLSISIVAMLLLAGQMFTQSYYVYLIRHYFGKAGIFVTLPTILTYIPMAIMMVFTPKLVRKFGKKEITAVGMTVAAVANLGMFFFKFLSPEQALWPFMGLCLISGFGLNLFVLQVWAMASDAIDDLEVKTGKREDGTAYSLFMFFRKMGQVVSAIAVNGALLAMGYFNSVEGNGVFEFTSNQLSQMYVLATIIPAVMFGIMAILLFVWYPLSKKRVAELQEEKEAYLRKELDNN